MIFRKRNAVLHGGKRTITAQVKRKFRMKRILWVGPHFTSGEPADSPAIRRATGAHGKAYDLTIYRGPHKVKLVIKKYYSVVYNRFFRHKAAKRFQSMIAEKEFGIMQRLKRKGYHVPPTARLVEVNGEKFLALTDLRKFGNVQTKNVTKVMMLVETGKIGKESFKEAQKTIAEETERAKQDENIDLQDSWEFVIDTKKKTVRAFILDLGDHTWREAVDEFLNELKQNEGKKA